MKEATKEPRLSLRISLQRYWYHLVGLVLFPTISALGTKYLHIPSGVFAVLFVGVTVYAAWPHWTKRAAFSFSLVGIGVWGVGIFLLWLVVTLIDAIHPSVG